MTNYRAKYIAKGVCISHPKVKAMRGHLRCEACILAHRRGGHLYNGGNKTAEILGIRVRLGMLGRVLLSERPSDERAT